jgi:uracil-DNA glycosylase
MTEQLVGTAWWEVLEEEFKQPYFLELKSKLREEYTSYKCYPKPNQIFRAFQLTDPATVKVVIIGMDPYFHNDFADGLAFSTQKQETPASLRYIFREVDRDVIKTTNYQEFKQSFPTNDLSSWAKQGVLLLNTSLTVRAGQPGSHDNIGWTPFIHGVLNCVFNNNNKKVIMLWGKHAKKIMEGIPLDDNDYILEAGHPATAAHGKDLFSGCNHFSKCNYYLWRNGLEEINWRTNG